MPSLSIVVRIDRTVVEAWRRTAAVLIQIKNIIVFHSIPRCSSTGSRRNDSRSRLFTVLVSLVCINSEGESRYPNNGSQD
jgi:hypothetical protein